MKTLKHPKTELDFIKKTKEKKLKSNVKRNMVSKPHTSSSLNGFKLLIVFSDSSLHLLSMGGFILQSLFQKIN